MRWALEYPSGWTGRGLTAIPALLWSLAAGCSAPSSRWLARRGKDLADCFAASAGYGFPAYARVRVTDFAVVGAGSSIGRQRYGWHGRYGGAWGWAPRKMIPSAQELGDEMGLPFLFNLELYDGPREWVATGFFCLTSREYVEGQEPGPRGRAAEKLWIEAAATLGVLSAQAGFNPAELADFVAGWVGWDMLKDDQWRPSAPKGQEPERQARQPEGETTQEP